MIAALGSPTSPSPRCAGLHFGGALANGEPSGNELAAAEIQGRLDKRFLLAPPR